MTNLFDGIASVISETLGDTVTITPLAGGAYDVVAIFREEPEYFELEQGGRVPTIRPALSVPADQLTALQVGDVVGPINGKTYRVISSQTAGSPAADGFIDIELEAV